jgi:4'-phosphopantetheinyl transferase
LTITVDHEPTARSRANERPALSISHLQVWQLRLDDDGLSQAIAGISRAPGGLLSADELSRAERFHFEKDRIRFTRCRSALRLLLSRFLDVPPEKIRFSYTTNGKPEVSEDQNPQSLRFNLSHSDNMAVIAVGVGSAIGVDIERMRDHVNTVDLAERFFSAREREALRSLPENLRFQAFYACWARKEAFLKANGEGLSFPLSDFSVSVHPQMPPRIQEIKGNANAALNWSLIDLTLAEGFRSAVAVEHPHAKATVFVLDALTIGELQ